MKICRKGAISFLIFISIPIICLAQAGGYALSFDGTDDYVSVPDHSDWDFGSADFSVEFWAKLAAYPTNNNGLVCRLTGDSQNNTADGWTLSIQANTYISFMGAYPEYPNWKVNNYSTAMTDYEWHHIAATRSGNTFSTYTDGILSNSSTWSGSFNDLVQELFIGKMTNRNNFHGTIDEVRIWEDARTADEIKENMHKQVSGTESNLVACWRFNENTGITTYDETSNDHDGTLTNGPTWTASTAPIGGYALDFDGSNDYIQVPDNNSLDTDLGDSFTIEAWIKTQEDDNNIIFAKHSAGSNGSYYFATFSGGKLQLTVLTNNGRKDHQVSYAYNDGNWHHVAGIYSGSDLIIYIDGVQTGGTTPQSGNVSNTEYPVRIGYYDGDPDWYYDGIYDEIRLWSDARSQSEIQANMFKELSGSEDGLVAYYKFNDGSGETATDSKGSNHGTLSGFSGTCWVTTIAPLATNFTSDKTDLISVWSADNSNASSILTIIDFDVSGSNRIAFGHDNGSLSANTSDKPSGIDRRLNRIWRVEVNAGLAGDLVFDCSGLGIGTSADLRLLEDQDGTFVDATIIEGNYSGTDFSKTSYTFKDGYYYTLASTSADNTLPVDLTDFRAIAGDGQVTLKWSTESELNNLGFNIYRNIKSNGQFSIINNQLIPGAGNSSQKHEYEYVDKNVTNSITYYYKLEDVDFSGNTKLHGLASAISLASAAPREFRLYSNYPNPFNPVTTICYDIPEDGYVELTIYNLRGEKVTTLIKSNQAAGSYKINWDGTDQHGELVSSGLYFLRIASGSYSKTNKMVFVR